ncbi:amidohydrolase [Arthrobacter sp. H5]|uniref:amidohydrolase n=1 Tax=Arthrobacter sp. H5 TaxID=1267973 RepID=UPI00047FB6F1|nr:amidohydrolase [Arthrobacter sp. H5]
MRIDCHQHLWPAAFIDALRERTSPPMLDRWTLLIDGEAPYIVDATAHDAEKRRAQEVREGKDQVLLSLSSPLGIEHLPFEDARKLIYTWHESSLQLGDPFRIWAATPVAEFDLDGLRDILSQHRIVGLQLPATALGNPAAIRRMKPVLDILQASNQPLLIHPGPAPATEDTPSWWPALVPYVSQLHASWLAWHAVGRKQHPSLRVAFVALAGLAPLHHERLAARGGEFGAVDPLVYYETSSYDTRAIDATIRVVGVDPIVHGSDRPYAEPRDPGLGHAFTHALFSTNPQHLLKGTPR